MELLHPIISKLKFCFILCVLFTSCNLNCNPEEYGLKFNRNRVRLGLVRIDRDWELKSSEGCMFIWVNKSAVVKHEKVLKIMDGEPYYEEDRYYNGNYSIIDPDQSDLEAEYVSVMYFFKDEEWDVTPHGKVDYINKYESNQSSDLCFYDYLHFDLGVSWNDLPTVDTTLFPMKKK